MTELNIDVPPSNESRPKGNEKKQNKNKLNTLQKENAHGTSQN